MPASVRDVRLPSREEGLLHATAQALPGVGERAWAVAQGLLGPVGGPDRGPRWDPPRQSHGAGRPAPFRSSLNADGSPLQVCLSMPPGGSGLGGTSSAGGHPSGGTSPGGMSVVLVADPGSEEPDGAQHHARGMRAMAGAADAQVGSASRGRLADMCQQLLPADIAGCPELAVGTMWLGIPLDGPGIGVYLNGAWGDGPARWGRVSRWLSSQGVPAQAWSGSLDAVSRAAHVSSVGVDLAADGGQRLKVYFRLDRPTALADLGVDLLTDPSLLAFLAEVVGDTRLPLAGIVLCMSFNPGAGRVVDVKADVCGHCLGQRPDWPARLDRLAVLMGSPPVDWEAWELGRRTQVAFLGTGVRLGGGARWNVYLKGA